MATTKSNTTDSLKAEIAEMLAEARREADKIISEAKQEALAVKSPQASTAKETPEQIKYWNEKVPFYAIKDDDLYKDDIVVGRNGQMLKIKRGVNVMIPRWAYQIIMQSQEQSAKLSDMQTEYETTFKEFTDRFSR